MSKFVDDEIEVEESAEQSESLIPMTIRLTSDVYETMKIVSDENNMKMSELCRRLLSRKLALSLKHIYFVEPEDGKELKREVSKIGSELERIRCEINHIGVNYNQDVKIRNAQVKQGLKPDWDPTQNLGNELSTLLARCDSLAKEMGDALCMLK